MNEPYQGNLHRQIVDGATDFAIIATDPDGRITEWNKGAARILGWSEAEILGQSITLFFRPEDVAAGRVEAEIRQALETGTGGAEGWRVRKDGRLFWANGQMAPLRNPNGQVIGFVKVVQDRSAQRQREEELRASEERLRIAQQAGGIGTFEWDPVAGTVVMSEEFRRLWGVEQDVLPLADLARLVRPEDRPRVGSLQGEIGDDALAYTEYRITRPDTGEERWIARQGEILRGAAGHVVRGFGVVYDITERKQADNALRESEAQFRTLAQVMPNHVWMADATGTLDWFNDKVYEYSGAAPGSLDGSQWGRIVHPEDVVAAAEAWGRSVLEGSSYQTEFRLRRADGAYRWHLARALPVRNAAGDVVRWIGTNTDIEDQKAAAAGLEHLNARLEHEVEERTRERDRLWQLSQELMLVCDYDGTISAVNPSARRILGWEPQEMVGHTLSEFLHPEDVASTAREVGKLSEGITTLAFENRYRHRDGSYRLLAWSAVPSEGFIHAVGRDITAEREAAEALRETEEALRQSQKMEAVGQLTGGIAHDFNNLLTGILGSIEMLQTRIRQGRTGELERYTTAASSAANRAAALTHRLLAFSRRQPLDPKPVNANQLITSMEDLLRRTSGETIQVETVTAAGLWTTMCDPNQLESAVLNLAINGRDAMPDGGKLTVETCNVMVDAIYAAKLGDVKPGQYICLCVSDTGTGMPKDVIEKAFDPFFTTKPIGQGTGLGLSMVYGFARQSEGFVRIYSEVGQGTTIKIYLPRYYGETVPEATDQAHEAKRGSGETVLVVEDEPTVRDLVGEILSELGYQVVEAIDGPSGLRLVESGLRIDLLITDVGLPGLNGRQLADAARLKRPGLKVLFMTGYAENAAIAGGFLEPGMEMITKPFSVEILADRIRQMIEDR